MEMFSVFKVVLSEMFYNELSSIEVPVNNNIYNYRRWLTQHLYFAKWEKGELTFKLRQR